MVSANQLAESAMLDVGDDTDADDLGDAGDGEDEYRDENDHRVEVGGKADESYSADRKSTRLNSSHKPNSYAVFCLKKKNSSYPSLPPLPDTVLSDKIARAHV